MNQLRTVALALIVVVAYVPPVAAQDKPPTAAQAFMAGERHFSKGDYTRAIESFELAYALEKSFKVLCNIALCHERQRDFVKATRYYSDCLSKGGDQTPAANAIRVSVARVEAKVARIEVQSGSTLGAVYVDGKRSGPAPTTVVVNPGDHVVELRLHGKIIAHEAITTPSGETRTVDLEIVGGVKPDKPKKQSVAKRRRLSSVWFWGAVGVTATLTVVTAILGGMALKKHSENQDNPTQDNHDSGVSLRNAANVTLGLTIAAAGAGTVLYFFTDFGGSAEEKRNDRKQTAFGIGLTGSF